MGRRPSSGPTIGEEELKQEQLQLFYKASSMTAISSFPQKASTSAPTPTELPYLLNRNIPEPNATWPQPSSTTSNTTQTAPERKNPTPYTKDANHLEEHYKIEYFLPETEFYVWKKTVFGDKTSSADFNNNYCGGCESYLDPLSPEGAVQAYRERRNQQGRDREEKLQKEYMVLAPSPPTLRNGVLDSRDKILNDLSDEGSNDAAAALEQEITEKKQSLHLCQSSMLINHGTRMTSLLQFHPYEPALVACDGTDSISIWNTDTSKKENSFRNGNPANTRVTSLSWINESTSSLLLTGSDDGSVRIWDGIIEGNGDIISDCGLSLSCAFFAMPELVANKRGSGLVTEWQQFSGRLVSAGNSNVIRCWDLESEKCINVLENNSNECVTTLTTAWDCVTLSDAQGSPLLTEGYSGIGPDIVVAGYGDGTLKIFDIRTNQRGATMAIATDPKVGANNSSSPQTGTRRAGRNRPMQYSEHTHWIVNTSFSDCGGRYEVCALR